LPTGPPASARISPPLSSSDSICIHRVDSRWPCLL
jgi:hypothetical protein